MPVERVGDHPEIAQPLVTAPCPVNLALECEDMPWLRNQEPLPAGHATELRESESLRSTRRPPRSRQCVEEFRHRRTTTQRHPAATPFAQGADMQHHLIHAPSGDAGDGHWATEHRSPSLLQ